MEKFIESIDEYVFLEGTDSCIGTLITRDTILTAAHCIPTQVEYTYTNEKNNNTANATSTIMVDLELDELIGSVYLGLNNVSAVVYDGHTKEGVYMNVSRIIIVFILKVITVYLKLIYFFY